MLKKTLQLSPAGFSKVCVTFQWTSGTKGLSRILKSSLSYLINTVRGISSLRTLLDPRRQPKWFYKIRSVHPSVLLSVLSLVLPLVLLSFRPSVRSSVCPGIFFELYLELFLNFAMVLETQMKLCVTEPDFPGKFFCPENWENQPKMGQKQGFLNLLENLVIKFF